MTETLEDNSVTYEDSGTTSLSLGGGYPLVVSPQMYRLSVDGVVGGAVTLGAGLMLSSVEAHDDAVEGDQSQTVTTVGIAPRLGGWLPVSRDVVLWPRGGFSYAHGSTESLSTNEFWLSVEPAMVFAMTNGFGLQLGATLDYLVEAGVEVEGDDRSPDTWDSMVLGLQLGLSGWL